MIVREFQPAMERSQAASDRSRYDLIVGEMRDDEGPDVATMASGRQEPSTAPGAGRPRGRRTSWARRPVLICCAFCKIHYDHAVLSEALPGSDRTGRYACSKTVEGADAFSAFTRDLLALRCSARNLILNDYDSLERFNRPWSDHRRRQVPVRPDCGGNERRRRA